MSSLSFRQPSLETLKLNKSEKRNCTVKLVKFAIEAIDKGSAEPELKLARNSRILRALRVTGALSNKFKNTIVKDNMLRILVAIL